MDEKSSKSTNSTGKTSRRATIAALLAAIGIFGGVAFGTVVASCGSDTVPEPETTPQEASGTVEQGICQNCSHACADGTPEDVFSNGLVGCSGTKTWATRNTLCGTGYRPATTQEWLFSRGSVVPTHNYWTDDNLGWTGSGSGNCAVSYSQGGSCGAQPMHVCTPSSSLPGTDGSNKCNWTDCGLDSNGPDQYFGGCSGTGNDTAGTLCIPSGGCADGSVEQTFANGVVGCAGNLGFQSAQTLCAADYKLVAASEWQLANGTTPPTHNYWVNGDNGSPLGLDEYSGTSGACSAWGVADSLTNPPCTAGQPMHPCTVSGTDSEGNACTLTNCTRAGAGPNEYYGGCIGAGNDTAGALCEPREGCADGSVEQHFTLTDNNLVTMVGCSGSLSQTSAAALCSPGYRLATGLEWETYVGNLAPTHNYWTSDNLRFSGTAAACSVATAPPATLCTSGQSMNVCTPGGTDPDGNACNWKKCGWNASTPNKYFGGCSSTAGALCVKAPYFISPTGNDSPNDGKSQSSPWQTWQHAFSQTDGRRHAHGARWHLWPE